VSRTCGAPRIPQPAASKLAITWSKLERDGAAS
jgi:hypothetical protein